MSEFGDLDELLADLDDAAETDAAAPAADGANDAEAHSAPGLGGVEPADSGMASRLEAMKRQGDMMKDLLASDEEDDADGAPGAAGGEAEVEKLLGEASRVIRAAVNALPEAASHAGYDDDDFESSPVSTPGSSVGSPSSSVSSARPADGQQAAQSSCPSPSDARSGGVSAAPSAAPAAQAATAGISIHQIQANVAGDDEEDYGDEDYEDEDFEEDMALRAGDASNSDPTAVSSMGASQSDQPLVSHAAHSRSLVHDKSSRTPIAQSIQMLQSDWMKEGSMQQRIYRVAVSKLAKSILMEVFNHCIDAHDERKRREEAIAARRKREAEANFAQPRACDVRIEEKKKQKLEAKRKKEAEKALRDAEYLELAKERAAKQRQEIKDSESQIAESKQRFKKMREEKEKKIEQDKRALLETNRQRVLDLKKQQQQNKQEIQQYVGQVREEEARERYLEKKELEEREAYRKYQQDVAVESMRAFINRQKQSKEQTKSKLKGELRAIMHSQSVFESSLRNTEAYIEKMVEPRLESKKRRIDSYVKGVLPIDNFNTGKTYTDALKLTSAIYFSPCESGTLLPQIKKKVGALTRTTVGPADGKRQIKAYQVISTLQDAYIKYQRWRGENGVKGDDLVAVLRRFKLEAQQPQMKRLIGEFGIEEHDALELDDFVEIGVAIFTILAPDVLVVESDGRRRSKSAEPLNFGKKSLADVHELERLCVSALGHTADISFTKSASIKGDLALHLAGSVKSRKAREREMLMLAQEALEIKKLRETRGLNSPTGVKASHTDASTKTSVQGKETPARKSLGGSNLGEGHDGQAELQTTQQPAVASSDLFAPSHGFLGPSPVPAAPDKAEAQQQQKPSASSFVSKKGPFSFQRPGGGAAASKPLVPVPDVSVSISNLGMHSITQNSAAGTSQSQGDAVHGVLKSVHATETAPSLPAGNPMHRSPSRGLAGQFTTGGTLSRPMTQQGSRPGSRQTPYREDEPIATEVLDSQTQAGTTVGFKFKMPAERKNVGDLEHEHVSSFLPQLKEGLIPLPVQPTANPAPPVDTTGMSRVQRMKLLQQQNAVAAGAHAATGLPETFPEPPPPQEVPISEPSVFPRRPRGNRPF